MKVSVVIPAYNEAKYITKSVRSVINQEIKADEIIVVDNNSTDKTAEIAKKLGAKVIKETKQGMIPARNKGFDTACGDIIARIDADVEVPTYWVRKIKKNYKNKKIDALTGPLIYSDAKLMSNSAFPSHLYLESLKTLSKGHWYLMGPNMSLTKNMWLKVRSKVNPNDKNVHEDIDLSLKIIAADGIIEYDRGLVVKTSARRINKHPESFFVEYPIRMVKTFIENSQRNKLD
ncbi:glycosyltransferase family 2 protein [Patescibacteria group bacterium]